MSSTSYTAARRTRIAGNQPRTLHVVSWEKPEPPPRRPISNSKHHCRLCGAPSRNDYCRGHSWAAG